MVHSSQCSGMMNAVHMLQHMNLVILFINHGDVTSKMFDDFHCGHR